METIEIGINKGKMAFFLVLSFLFVVLAAWVYFDYSTTNPPIEPAVLRVISICFMSLFGLVLIVGGKRFLTLNTGVKITSEGIHDFTNKFGIDCIRWEDVKIVHETNVGVTNMAQIDVKDPQSYIAKGKNGMQRWIMKSNLRHHGSPFVIASSALKIKHQDLVQLLKDEFNAYKKRQADAASNTVVESV
jgi:hypothetical protein